MNTLLEYTIFGNPLQEWLIAAAYIVGSVIVAKALYWVFGRFFKRMAERTTSKLDDILIDALEEPVLLAVVIIGMWWGYDHLEFGDSLQIWMQRVFLILIAINITWLITRFIDAVISEFLVPYAEKSEGSMDQVMPIIRKSIKALVWTLGIVLALNNAGYDVGALLAGVGIGGIALAMAAKDFVANIFGGITVFIDKPFKVGDRIEIAGYDGFVREVGIRSTRLQTLAGRVVTIPNMKFTDTTVENITMEPSRRVKTTVGLVYGSTTEQLKEAEAIMADIVENHPFTEESCLIWFEDFAAYSLNISLIYYIQKEGAILNVQNEINLELFDRFTKAGLSFAFPTQTVYHEALQPSLPDATQGRE